jgi:hypothetical protein
VLIKLDSKRALDNAWAITDGRFLLVIARLFPAVIRHRLIIAASSRKLALQIVSSTRATPQFRDVT